MSVVIAAPQAVSPSILPATDSTAPTDSAANGTDFASLLLGQLAAGANLQTSISEEDIPRQTDGANGTGADPSPQDAAMMLAALGMMPLERTPGRTPEDGPEPGDALRPGKAAKTDQTLAANLLGTNAASATKDLPAASLAATQEAERGGNTGKLTFQQDPAIDIEPAKFAVADHALPGTDAAPKGVLADDSRSTGNSGAVVQIQAPIAAKPKEVELKVETAIRDHTWANDFSQKIVWLANNDKQTAQLTLNPPQMGPIEISLNLNKDGTSALFVSQNAEVRETIETALPRLREMFAEAGIQLGQTNVSAESFRQQAGNDEARQGAPRWLADNAILGSDSAHGLAGQLVITQRGNGLVDTFA